MCVEVLASPEDIVELRITIPPSSPNSVRLLMYAGLLSSEPL